MAYGNKLEGNRFIFFDALRIIAIFAVIWLHVSATVWWDFTPSSDWYKVSVYMSLVRWGVPVFVMISGALFLNPNKQFSIKRLYKKNIVRITAAYLFWSCLYAIRPNFTINQFIGLVIQGPFHFWFLKMLIGLYVLIPILRKISSDRKVEEYFLILAFFTSFLFPWNYILDKIDNESISIIKNFINTVNLKMTVGYTGYFVLGHYLYTYQLKKKTKIAIYILATISFVCAAIGTILICRHFNRSDEVLFSNSIIFTLLESMAVFIYAKSNFNHFSTKYQKDIVDLSKMSFGIYLVHVFILKAAESYGINAYSFNPLLSIPIISVIVFIISYFVAKMIGKLPFLKKYVI